jgi:hypothetical protein
MRDNSANWRPAQDGSDFSLNRVHHRVLRNRLNGTLPVPFTVRRHKLRIICAALRD